LDKGYETHYHELEEKYWWFISRRHMLCRMIDAMNLPRNAAILDIGCSGGALIKDLNSMGYENITGIDISSTAIALSKRRGIPNTFEMDGVSPEFAPSSFDLIIASDVLEHIDHAEIAVCNWKNLLRPGGRVIVFVPAFDFLWSEHDTINHHYKRYTVRELSSLLKGEGLIVRHEGYWNVLLFLPVLLFRTLFKSKRSTSGQLVRLPSFVNWFLVQILKIENVVGNKISLPFGVSCFVVSQRS
jgi:SAM-dependent methyltransferase